MKVTVLENYEIPYEVKFCSRSEMSNRLRVNIWPDIQTRASGNEPHRDTQAQSTAVLNTDTRLRDTGVRHK